MIPKLRAWLKDEQEMHDVLAFDTRGHSFLGIEGPHVTVDDWCDVFEVGEQAELMQSTGLKDKSAKYEINNKDILLVDTFPESSFKAKVVYETGSFGVVALKGDIVDYFPKHWNDTFMPLAELYWIFDCEDGVLDCVEILGNEFENPELLEEQR
ncbi:YopX family protein [Enterococcus mundtii]|uniref:YopX family protein n=1 Tax=Enterococcus mundtii TaxID=53346 RepID=UPI002DB8D40D|nr:YopX family protein [Enterococcus mundtii]MEC3942748.1 YopX family protein [Enterococcus mundtii]